MHMAAECIQQLLHNLGVRTEVVEFGASTRTSAEAATAIGTTVAQICKSIVWATDGGAVLVIASGANRIDTAKVEQHVGKPLAKANAAFVREQTGYVIGGVPPIGHAHQVPIFIDQDLLRYPVVYAAAGTPNTIFPITPPELLRVTGGSVIDCRVDEAGG